MNMIYEVQTTNLRGIWAIASMRDNGEAMIVTAEQLLEMVARQASTGNRFVNTKLCKENLRITYKGHAYYISYNRATADVSSVLRRRAQIIDKNEENKPSIIIGTNIFVFMEALSVVYKYGIHNIFVSIDPNYVKSTDTAKALLIGMRKLEDSVRYIEWGKVGTVDWKNMICPSYAPDAVKRVYEGMHIDKIILVEDGSYDYYTENMTNIDFMRGKELHLFRPKESIHPEYFKAIYRIKIGDTLMQKVMSIYKREMQIISKLDKRSAVLFTSPLGTDFNSSTYVEETVKWLEDNINGTDIIVKKHPMDLAVYKSSKIRIMELNTTLPGQITDMYFNGLKVFTFPSTICFMSGKTKDMIILRFRSIKHEGYNEFFDMVKDDRDYKIKTV